MPKKLYDFRAIRKLRKKCGLTIEQLAEKTGIAYTTLVAIESNKTHPSLKTLDALALVLRVPTSQLVRMSELRQVQKRKLQLLAEKQRSRNNNAPVCHIAKFDTLKITHIFAKGGAVIESPQPHEEVYEFCYVLDGIVELHIEELPYLLETNDIFLFDGTLHHYYRQIESGEFISILIPKDIRIIECLLTSPGP